jgi:hemerythrin-like domain-containing protein
MNMGVTSAIESARKAVRKAVSGESDPRDQDLLDTLKTEHDEVKQLLADLEDASVGAQRKALVRQIKVALVPHTKAEERVLYASLIKLTDKKAQTDGYEGNVEHDLAAKTLHKLGGIANATSPEHKATAKVLRELVGHHIQDEERNIWSDVKEHFSHEERVAMNRRFLAAKTKVKIS